MKQRLNLLIPKEFVEFLREYAKANYKSMTQVVVELLVELRQKTEKPPRSD